MLLAVEGGFISSSASGYSKGLAFLLFGRRDDDHRTPMRVLPWTPHNHPNHHPYRLFPAEIDSSLTPAPLAQPSKSGRAKTRRGYARFLFCFSRPSPDAAASLPSLKVEPENASSGVSLSGCRIGEVPSDGVAVPAKIFPKSSLKKSLPGKEVQEKDEGKDRVVLGTASKRKVQWTDVHGRELTEIREFEPSEVGESGDERDDNGRICSCIIG